MAYLKDFQRSKLYKNNKITKIIGQLMLLPALEKLVVKGGTQSEVIKLRYDLYKSLNAVGIKNLFKLYKPKYNKTGNFYTIIILKTAEEDLSVD